MFEDALFSHARGAFTGAVSDSQGDLAEADKGTVFLDEIGGLPPGSQAKLSRAIESQIFRSVGASCDRRGDFRAVAASSEDLHGMCDAGSFRLDLLHRLAGITLRMPPLSARRDDIPVLAQAFLRQATANNVSRASNVTCCGTMSRDTTTNSCDRARPIMNRRVQWKRRPRYSAAARPFRSANALLERPAIGFGNAGIIQ